MADSYSTKITGSKLMIDALKANRGEVSKIDEAYVEDFAELKDRAEALNTEQEKLKAALKAKTAELDATMKDLTHRCNEVEKAHQGGCAPGEMEGIQHWGYQVDPPAGTR